MQGTIVGRRSDSGRVASFTSTSMRGVQSHATLGRIGTLETRLARNEAEIAAAQEVRYRVFYEERGVACHSMRGPGRRDADRFDAICDHLLVLDTALDGPDPARIVGTYRLLRQECADEASGFYTEDEFDLKRLIANHPGRRFLELGRSCVLPAYRTKRTIELLWKGIWAYCNGHGIDVMTGCASFAGVVPAAHAEPLSFLHHTLQATGDWYASALPHRYSAMDLMPVEAIDPRSAVAAMPPLIKGYLRLGARFGDGCVVDPEFGTTDVLVILPVEAIARRYLDYYGAEAQRFAA